MSERITFLILQPDHTYIDGPTVWAHILKDGFTRTETENWFKIMVREQQALSSLLDVGGRIRWKNRMFEIFSWQDPSYESHGFIEIMAKQIASTVDTNHELFKDVVNIYRMTKIETVSFGLPSYKYEYDFNNPTYTNQRCLFASDQNKWIEDKKTDVEHNSLIVKFPNTSPVLVEDYIESTIWGLYKVEMITKNRDNMLEAHVTRGEVQ